MRAPVTFPDEPEPGKDIKVIRIDGWHAVGPTIAAFPEPTASWQASETEPPDPPSTTWTTGLDSGQDHRLAARTAEWVRPALPSAPPVPRIVLNRWPEDWGSTEGRR